MKAKFWKQQFIFAAVWLVCYNAATYFWKFKFSFWEITLASVIIGALLWILVFKIVK
jgi:hypothetical protein